jgi:protein tyrosine/serine phosphatase
VLHKKFLLTAIPIAALAVAISIIVFGIGSTAKSSSSEIGSKQPVDETSAEVTATLPLFRRVDVSYFRGSEPARGGIAMLVRLGVKTIVDLRSVYDHNDDIRDAAQVSGLGYEWVPMSIWDPPTDAEANKFISLVTDAAKAPFFVFCADGLNRTGEMTAIYRVAHSGWSVEKALAEADEVGFNPYYWSLRNYVWDYARKFRPSAVPTNARRVS